MLGLFFIVLHLNLPRNEYLYNTLNKYMFHDLNSDVYNRNMLLYP